MDKVLTVSNLSKTFHAGIFPSIFTKGKPSCRALDDITFSIDKKGLITCISGPNGSGKTTLLRCIAGLLIPTTGKISIFNMDINKNAFELKKRIGVSTDQERSFYWRLTGRENILFFAGLFGFTSSDINRKMHYLAEILDIESWLDTPFSKYSTGIRQRFSLMRALIHDPDLVLLDEPYRSLDKKSRFNLASIFQDISKKKKTTIIYTNNEMDIPEIPEIRNIMLKKGRII